MKWISFNEAMPVEDTPFLMCVEAEHYKERFVIMAVISGGIPRKYEGRYLSVYGWKPLGWMPLPDVIRTDGWVEPSKEVEVMSIDDFIKKESPE